MDIQQAFYAARLVRREGFDTVLSLSERVGIPLSLMLDRKIKHVVIMHHAMSAMKLRMMRALKIADRIDKIITISPAETAGLRAALNAPEGKVETLLTPVDVDFWQPQEAQPNGEAPHFLSLGLSYRDYPTLLRAMRSLTHVHGHIRAGSTWVAHRAGYEEERIPENIALKPYVHPSELRDVIARSRFVVVPIRNTTQWSAGCTSVQLAQAMGKAIITTRIPGLESYMRDGETGLLVDCGDVEGMRRAIDDLWQNPEKAEMMGRRGRELVQSTVSIDEWLKKLGSVLAPTAVMFGNLFESLIRW